MGLQFRRGAPRLPDQWTRVISLSEDDLETFHPVSLETDLMIAATVEGMEDEGQEDDWQPYFFP